MDYRKMIIELLEKVENKSKLEYIYYVLKSYLLK